jgi:AcrR family transcriptional regulator
MEVQDRRVRRTQHLLARALIALTLEKGYEAVTIRDITERADIGYATFFRHYHDKDELLKDVLDVVLTDLIDLLRPSLPDADQTMGSSLGPILSLPRTPAGTTSVDNLGICRIQWHRMILNQYSV